MALIYEDYDAINFPGIKIYYDKTTDPTYALTIRGMLDQIVSQQVGFLLLQGLSPLPAPAIATAHGFTVRIYRAKPTGFGVARMVDLTSGAVQPSHNTSNKAVRSNDANARNGTGTTTTVHFNTNSYRTPHGPRPPYVALAHELIHALHNLNGDAVADTTTEENRTVGIGSSKFIFSEPITENKVRLEHNLPLRMVY